MATSTYLNYSSSETSSSCIHDHHDSLACWCKLIYGGLVLQPESSVIGSAPIVPKLQVYSIFNIQYYSSASCAMHTRTDCPMQHYAEVKDWSDMRYKRNLSANQWKSIMGVRARQDTGNTGTTIQVRHSAGICAATSSLQPSLLSHCCKLDPRSVPPSCHQLHSRTLPPDPP